MPEQSLNRLALREESGSNSSHRACPSLGPENDTKQELPPSIRRVEEQERAVDQWAAYLRDLRLLIGEGAIDGLSARPAHSKQSSQTYDESLDKFAWAVVDALLLWQIVSTLQIELEKLSAVHSVLAAIASGRRPSARAQGRADSALVASAGLHATTQNFRVSYELWQSVVELTRSAPTVISATSALGPAYEVALSHRLARAKAKGARLRGVVLLKDTQKRSQGVYFTPEDVATHVTGSSVGTRTRLLRDALVQARSESPPSRKRVLLQILSAANATTVLDPACGGGAFVLHVAREFASLYSAVRSELLVLERCQHPPDGSKGRKDVLHALEFPGMMALQFNVFGVDVDARAVLYARFALILQIRHELMRREFRSAIDLLSSVPNLYVGDSVAAGSCCRPSAGVRRKSENPPQREADRLPAPKHSHQKGTRGAKPTAFERVGCFRTTFASVFSSTAAGFAIVLGNPPYARLGAKAKSSPYSAFETAACGDAFAIFVELSLELASPTEGQVALVVPLSVAFSARMLTLRRILLEERALSVYEHFDNMPDTIFRAGKPESTNTNRANSQRVTIVHVDRRAPRKIASTDLQRWFVEERPRLFKTSSYADVTAIASVRRGIPKTGNAPLVKFLEIAFGNGMPLRQLVAGGNESLFVPTTARYYIPALDTPQARPGELEIVGFGQREKLCAAAIINSNVFYWFWRVFGDGFHVTRAVIDAFPVPLSMIAHDAESVGLAVRELWGSRATCDVSKKNSGHVVHNTNFNLRMDLLMRLDDLILRGYGVEDIRPADFARYKEGSTLSSTARPRFFPR